MSALFEKYGLSFSSGQTIFSEGEDGQYMYIIQSGCVQISKNMDGHEHVLGELTKGEFFGEMAIVTRVKRTATAKALDDVQVLAFSRADFQGMIEKNSRIAMNVIDKLCRRLQHANSQIRHLVHANFKSAIALNLYLRFSRVAGGGALTLDRTVREIAKNIGIDAPIVQQVIDELAGSRVVAVEGNAVKLMDEGALCRVADESL